MPWQCSLPLAKALGEGRERQRARASRSSSYPFGAGSQPPGTQSLDRSEVVPRRVGPDCLRPGETEPLFG